MRKKPIFKLGFTKLSDQAMIVFVNFVIDCMTGNALYTDSGAKLTALLDSFNAFLVVLGQKGRVINYKGLHEDAKAEVRAALKELGIYARDKYPGNVTNWETTGYEIQTFEGATQIPETPTNVSAKDGRAVGEVMLAYDKKRFASNYEGRFWKEGELPPTGITSITKKKVMSFPNLAPGKTYCFQVRARGTKGVSEWTALVLWIPRMVAGTGGTAVTTVPEPPATEPTA